MENRIIKFRGKRIKDGKWIYGNLADYSMKVFNTTIEKKVIFGNIVSFATDNFGFVVDDCAVDPETIGQFTGLRDKDSRPIYEGDIVEAYDLDEELAFMGAVRYALPDAAFGIDKGTGASLEPFEGNMTYKVVGNFHDNIESLNGK